MLLNRPKNSWKDINPTGYVTIQLPDCGELKVLSATKKAHQENNNIGHWFIEYRITPDAAPERLNVPIAVLLFSFPDQIRPIILERLRKESV